MDVFHFEEIVKSERLSRRHIDHIGRLTGESSCPKCGSPKSRKTEEGHQRKCSECGYKYRLYSGRWFGEVNLPARTWLWIVKLFEMELTSTRIAEETEVIYPTVLKATATIRKAIAASTDHGLEILMNGGRNRKIPVFHYADEANEQAGLIPLPEKHIHLLERLGCGHLICTDKSITYNSLECGGVTHHVVDSGKGFPHFRTYLAYPKGVWARIKEQLRKYHSVKDKNLPLYILEMEFRINNRDSGLFEKLVESLCRSIPRELRPSGTNTSAPTGRPTTVRA